jgi:uncharacterized repeat protein (TIGR03803 family)
MRISALVFALLGVAIAEPASAITDKVLYSFPNSSESAPVGQLLWQNGNLFVPLAGGPGYVFELTESGGVWSGTPVYTFDTNPSPQPAAGLIQNSAGALFGTTYYGGTYGENGGTAYVVANSGGTWTGKLIWNFGGTGDGSLPADPLVVDSAGNLYGTTETGGANTGGTVFELSTCPRCHGWSEKILFDFGNPDSDNYFPTAGLLMDSSGNLFGTTTYGGTDSVGTVFELSPSGSTWTQKVLYNFTGGTDGGVPYAGLIEDASGNLYGTTSQDGKYGYGTVFEISLCNPKGCKETTLHQFADGNDGADPGSSLRFGCTVERNGCLVNYAVLYGTTPYGGTYNEGTAYGLSLSGSTWTEFFRHSFGSGHDGVTPSGGVVLDGSGNIYGVTYGGGTSNNGIVYEITP